MTICRFVGWILIFTALGTIAYEATTALNAGRWRTIAIGELWFQLHAPSLNNAQASIQRYVLPWLWEPVITTVLRGPGWLVFGAPGITLVYLCRKRRPF